MPQHLRQSAHPPVLSNLAPTASKPALRHRAFVVRDFLGARVACATLGLTPALEAAEFRPAFGARGAAAVSGSVGPVTTENHKPVQKFAFALEGEGELLDGLVVLGRDGPDGAGDGGRAPGAKGRAELGGLEGRRQAEGRAGDAGPEEVADDEGAVSKRGLRRGWSEIGEDGGMSALAEVLRHANLERLMSAALRQNV